MLADAPDVGSGVILSRSVDARSCPISDGEPGAPACARRVSSLRLSSMKCRLLSLAVVAVGACSTSNVKPLGPPMPARPVGCAVAFFSRTPPPYEYIDIASVKARCRYSADRIGCEDELRAKACALGGDTVYGFARAATRDHTLVSAKVAYRRKSGADLAAGPAQCAPACGSEERHHETWVQGPPPPPAHQRRRTA